MAYRIVYGSDPVVSKKKNNRVLRLQTLTAVCFLLFALSVKLSWSEGFERLRAYLIPGDMTVTQEAFQSLVERLHEGEHVGDALTTFCRDIITNG